MKKPSRVDTRTVFLKGKAFSFILFHHFPILFLHIENLYKVGNGNLLGQLLATPVELVGQAYWLRIRNANDIVLGKRCR